MPDQQRIEIEIALRDSISGALKQVAKEFDSVTRKLAEGGAGAGSNIRKLGNETDKLRESSQRTSQSLTAMGGMMRGIGGAILGTAGIAAGIAAAATSLERFSSERVRLRAFGVDTGLATDQIRKLRYALQLNGLSASEADQKIGGFFGKLREMQTFGPRSQFYEAMSKAGGGAIADKMRDMANNNDAWGALMEYVGWYERQDTEAQRNYLALISDLNKSILGSLRRNLADVAGVRSADVSEEQVRKYLRQMTVLRAGLGSVWDQMAHSTIEAVVKIGQELGKQGVTAESFGKKVATVLSYLGPFAKFVASQMSGFTKFISNTAKEIRAIKKFFSIPETSLPGRAKVWEDHAKQQEQERKDREALDTSSKTYKTLEDINRFLGQMILPPLPSFPGTTPSPSSPSSPAPSPPQQSTPAARPQPVPQTATPETAKPTPVPQTPSRFPGAARFQERREREIDRPVPPQQQTPSTRPVPIAPGSRPPTPLRQKVSMADEMEFSAQRRGSGLQDLIKRQMDNYVARPWHPSSMIPGSGVLRFMKSDDAAGNPSRALMRSMLGLEGDSGKEIDRSLARALGGADTSGTLRADIDFGDMPLAGAKGGAQKNDPFLPLKMEGHPQAGKASALMTYNRWTF